jgi:flavin reductase (DIM6/NTAB) family NADH-FMN oxidoreductase RutF
MKRLALAGSFTLIGGAAALLMLVSILYSCRQGGQPHDMGTQSWTPTSDEPPAVAFAPAPESSPETVPARRAR